MENTYYSASFWKEAQDVGHPEAIGICPLCEDNIIVYALDSHCEFDQDGVVTCAAHGVDYAKQEYYRPETDDYDFRDGHGAVSPDDMTDYLSDNFYRTA